MNLKVPKRFIQDEMGIEGAEYAMILALICTALIAAVITLATQIEGRFNSTAKTINDLP